MPRTVAGFVAKHMQYIVHTPYIMFYVPYFIAIYSFLKYLDTNYVSY